MSDPIDIKALDEYLKGGSDISQRYRDLGSEDVPPELDRRVLDEARAAVASGGAARSRSLLRLAGRSGRSRKIFRSACSIRQRRSAAMASRSMRTIHS